VKIANAKKDSTIWASGMSVAVYVRKHHPAFSESSLPTLYREIAMFEKVMTNHGGISTQSPTKVLPETEPKAGGADADRKLASFNWCVTRLYQPMADQFEERKKKKSKKLQGCKQVKGSMQSCKKR
jgi:hypothetical protein